MTAPTGKMRERARKIVDDAFYFTGPAPEKRKLRRAIAQALADERAEALEEAALCQPCTAEAPNESSYERGRFDMMCEYQKAIRALGGKK